MYYEDDLPPPDNRWYDQNNRISVAIRLLKKFPLELQEMLCRGISLLAEKDYKARELMSHVKSLGPEKVLAVHKSKLKRRLYDANPIIHKTINYLFLFSDRNRAFIAERILELMDLIQDYLRLCQEYQTDPDMDQVETLTYTYVNRGPEQAKIILKRIDQEFMKRVKEQIRLTGDSGGRITSSDRPRRDR